MKDSSLVPRLRRKDYIMAKTNKLKGLSIEELLGMSYEEAAQKTAKDEGKSLQDFGTKLGGARKDDYERITVEQVDELNEYERAEIITKDTIWPVEDLNEIKVIRGEISRERAFLSKLVRDAITTEVGNPHYPNAYEVYIEEVNALKQIAENCESFAELRTQLTAYLERKDEDGNRVYIKSRNYGNYNQIILSDRAMVFVSQNRKTLFNIFDWTEKDFQERLRKSNFGLSEEQKLSKKYYFTCINEEKQLFRCNTSDEIGNVLLVLASGTLEECKAAALEHNAARKRVSVNHFFRLPQLERLERTGEDVRHGKDAEPDDFLRQFGIRGAEFGNWMPQDERVQNFNHCYDAYHDLATILGVPDDFVSFNHTLGIGFGSRGRQAAAAHFEPAYNAINLTRMSGAGSLGHEWIHGVDYATRSKRNEEVYHRLLYTLKYRYQTAEEYQREQKSEIVAELRKVATAIYSKSGICKMHSQLEQLTKETKPCPDDLELLTEKTNEKYCVNRAVVFVIDKCLDKFLSAGSEQTYADIMKEAVSYMKAKMAKVFYEATLKLRISQRQFPDISQLTEYEISVAIRNIQQYAKEYQRSINGEYKVDEYPIIKTDFLRNAEDRGSAYWIREEELLARAGALYLFDKAKRMGIRNDYLSGHALYNAPSKADMVYIAPAMDDFFVDIKELATSEKWCGDTVIQKGIPNPYERPIAMAIKEPTKKEMEQLRFNVRAALQVIDKKMNEKDLITACKQIIYDVKKTGSAYTIKRNCSENLKLISPVETNKVIKEEAIKVGALIEVSVVEDVCQSRD